MRSVQVSKPQGALEVVERNNIPEPGSAQVRIKVQACGICHSDYLTKDGLYPGIQYPRVPGHEIAGIIDAVGKDVNEWKSGQRVGVGWHGGHCGHCDSCRRGDFTTCSYLQIPGISYDGGYADYMIAPKEAVASIPDELSPTEAAPLMCAGITTYNALRNSGARPGDVVAILGIGGLGHLAIQFSNKMGFKTIAIGRGKDKAERVRKLGAIHYIDTNSVNAAEELQKYGGSGDGGSGAKVILATVPSAKAMNSVLGGLAVNGKLVVIGHSDEPIEVPTDLLLLGRRSLVGWASGTATDSQDTLSFSVLSGVRPMTEVYPLERAAEAYQQMISGKARFRAVLTTEH
ncbi:Zn-dependent alcohol dehydrogenase [Candidatus Nitrososphaera evergladensis SR1]|uniref:Zn-dependent alcohol dehydrogenase n=1 Tax=Candidatus Nitrososphaera evergladensis SR1 TaxID=1459636 RepID=A0A075MQ89_9ARCH|nr:alcohol dehydrogenase [Candidatus Nitrososphaera evergladensis]AIF83235.1 Zn-dependent alcohol dehydrogenase [Candidatus Nitrososphaera evergladensis SR1]